MAVGRLWTGTPIADVPKGMPKKGAVPPHLVKHLWRPGQSGGGHEHKVPSYRDLMRRRMRELAAARKGGVAPGEEERLIVDAHLAMIIQDRNVAALREWLDREHGPVVQRVEQNVSLQDVTRREFEAFMTRPRDVEVESPGESLELPPSDAECSSV